MNRKEAQAAGLTHYYDGKPCWAGHAIGRYTSNGGCMGCIPSKLAKPLGYDESLRMAVRVHPGVPPEMRVALKAYLLEKCVPAFFAQYGRLWNGEEKAT